MRASVQAAELEANRKALQRKKDAEHRLRLRTGKPSTATAPTAVEAKAEATPAGGENKDDAECDLASRKAEAKNLLRRFDKDPDSVTLSDLVETVARLGLEGKEAVEEEDAMKKQLVAQLREELPATPRKARTSERAPRRPGREKGTILWRVQPEFGDILVKDPEVDPHGPGDMSFVQAVKSARPGARIFVRGHHSWSGFLELDKCVHIVGAGAWVTKLTGRWWLQHYADLPEQDAEMDTLAVFSSIRPVVAGFSGVELTHVAGRDRTLNLVGNYMAETVVVQGGSWRFHACKLTCSGAPPLVTAARSLVKMLECRVGGIDQDTHRASSGVVVTGESRCCLHTCVIEYTDNQDYTQVVDSLPEIKRAASPRKDAGSAGAGGGFLGAKSKPAGLAGGLLGGKGGGGMGGLFGGRSLAPKTDAPPTIGDVLSKFRSAAVVVRHTGKAELDCCQLLNNYMAVAVSDCGAVCVHLRVCMRYVRTLPCMHLCATGCLSSSSPAIVIDLALHWHCLSIYDASGPKLQFLVPRT